VIADVLENQHERGGVDDLTHRRQVRTMHRGDRAPVHGETGQRLRHVVRDDVHRYIEFSDDRSDVLHPPLLNEDRSRTMPRSDCSRDDFRRFGDVQPAGRVAHTSERGVGQCAIVVESSIIGIRHAQQFHEPQSAIALRVAVAVGRDASSGLHTP